MTHHDRIETNPKVMLGKPVIRDTRIPVALLLRKLSEGATEADLLDAYPRLARQDVRAVVAYAKTAGVGFGSPRGASPRWGEAWRVPVE